MFKKTKFLKIFSLSLLFCLCFLAGRGAAALSDHASSARLTSGRISQAAENWGLSFQEEGAPPVGNATCEELKTYDAYYREDTEEKVLYLTFDCGYENGNTPRILEALKKHRAPATFFVVGNYLDTSPDLVRQMIREGHAVGNHTFHHPDMSQISGKEAFQKELEDVEKAFREITGKPLSRYYRPPQGKYSPDNLKMAQELGYHTFFWSLAHVDWIQDDQPTREEALDKLLSRVHPGAIVLLHNTSATNGAILDELLTRWEEMGYSFRPLEDLIHGSRKEDSSKDLPQETASVSLPGQTKQFPNGLGDICKRSTGPQIHSFL